MAQAISENLNIITADMMPTNSASEQPVDFNNVLQNEIANDDSANEDNTSELETETIVNNIQKTLSEIISDAFSVVVAENVLNLTIEKNIETNPENPEITEIIDENNAQIGDEEMNKTTTITDDVHLLSQCLTTRIDTSLRAIEQQTEENSPIDESNNLLLQENKLNSFDKDLNYISKNNNLTDLAKTELSQKENTKSIKDLVSEEVIDELKLESLEVQTETSEAGNDMMQNQTPQEQGVKAMLGIEDTKINKSDNVVQQEQMKATTQTNTSKILEQISKQIGNLKTGSKVNMVLNPESLGKVSLQIINTKEGLAAQFTVTTNEARSLLMQGLDGLKENLLSQGVNVDNISVKLNEIQESEYNADWLEQDAQDNYNGGHKKQNKEQKNKNIFEELLTNNNEEEDYKG